MAPYVTRVNIGVAYSGAVAINRDTWDDLPEEVQNAMVAAGITSILNFAPQVLSVPEGVDVRKVDLSIELQILAYHQQRKASAVEGAVLHAPGDAGGADDLDGRLEAPA